MTTHAKATYGGEGVRSPTYHIRNTVSGLLVPDDKRRGPRTFHSTFDAVAWITNQYRPQDFEVVAA